MKGLTKKQREILDFIQSFITTHRYAPTYREIGSHFHYKSKGTVHKHIESLKNKGVLTNAERMSRSLTLAEELIMEPSQNEVAIPIAGEISAGNPIKTYSTMRMLTVPSTMATNTDSTYALFVHGHTFTEELIADGDFLIIEARQEAHPGETVVALINGTEVIVKKYYLDGKNAKLVGTQPHHNPLIVNAKNIAIHGVVIGLIRTYG